MRGWRFCSSDLAPRPPIAPCRSANSNSFVSHPGDTMASSRSARTVVTIGFVSMLALALAGCNSMTLGPTESVQQEPQPEPEIPATIRADEIVGRWGLASYHKPDDRARTENAARGQCKQPYVIGKGQ